jgi:hypothetical protein
MGQYTELYLGNYYVSWKNFIPDYLALVFDEPDFYCVPDVDNDWYAEIGYKTICNQAIQKLEKFGFSLLVVSEIYGFFYKDLVGIYTRKTNDYISTLMRKDSNLNIEPIKDKQHEQLDSLIELSHLEEIQNFVSYIKQILSDEYKNPWSKRMELERKDGNKLLLPPRIYKIRNVYHSGHIEIDFEELLTYLDEDCINNPPWLIMLVSLFSQDYDFFYEYPEIVTLLLLRILLEAIDDKTVEIKLELSDIIEDEEEARLLIHGLGDHLIDKISLYNRVFHTLFLKEEDIRTNYIKAQCKEYLDLCKKTDNPYDKGKVLENLTELLFTSNNSLELVSKRVSTGDEEIDLLIKNNINRPFWIAFSSPLLFVECKNWINPVGASEIRNFEIKLQNHRNVAKVGFFVSLNGFTSGAMSEFKRLSRENYHIVAIRYEDINEFVNSSEQFFEWLEDKASKIY